MARLILNSSQAFVAPQAPAGASNTGTLTIDIQHPATLVAPCQFTCEVATVSGFSAFQDSGTIFDPKFHEIRYVWWLESGPLSWFSSPVNMLTRWKEPNIAYGPKAAFVVPTSGSVTIHCLAVDRAHIVASASETFTVVSKEATYTGSNMICLSTGGFTGAPAGAQQLASIAAVNSAIAASTGPMGLLVRRGEDLTGHIICGSGDYLNHVGVFGSGNRPILRPTAFSATPVIDWSSNCNNDQIVMESLDLRGPWNPVTEQEFWGAVPFEFDGSTSVNHVTLHDMRINGFEKANYGSVNDAAAHKDVVLNDTVIENWGDYAVWNFRNETGRFAAIGSRFTQDPDACQIIQGKEGLTNQHGPVRLDGVRWIVGRHLDLFSNNGWLDTVQPCWRVGTNEFATGIEQVLDRCVMENGYQIVNSEGENTSAEDAAGNFLYDKCLFITTTRSNRRLISLHKGGPTSRNCLVYMPNVPHGVDADYTSTAWRGAPNNSVGNNNSEPFRIYNCGVVSELSDANDGDAGAVELCEETLPFTDVLIENNMRHVPNAASPVTGNNPDLTTVMEGVTPRCKGTRANYEWVTGNNTVADDASLTVPLSSILRRDKEGNGPGIAVTQGFLDTYRGSKTKFKANSTVYHEANGELEVSHDGSNVTITNRSGSTWSGDWILVLDISAALDVDLPYDATKASPPTIPTCIHQAGSNLLDPGSGRFAIDDFFGDYRPLGNQDAGPFQVTT